jgi:6-pyruvoyltetrahydropterin/6-carboxytetrahydropterin synthase
MFRLTREVRFAVNREPDEPKSKPSNGFGGVPPLRGLGHYFVLRVALQGELDPASQYLRNIKDVDAAVRRRGVGIVAEAIAAQDSMFALPGRLMDQLKNDWPGAAVHELTLFLSPFLSVGCLAREYPMVRLSQKFEFSASHRLHNPKLSDAENRRLFGKCNNPFGHGHNYEVQVTLAGEPDANGLLIDVPVFERVVAETAIERLDHKNLNVEVAEFSALIPTVENIAKVIYQMLKPKFADERAPLASVTVWETPKTWCEYGE